MPSSVKTSGRIGRNKFPPSGTTICVCKTWKNIRSVEVEPNFKTWVTLRHVPTRLLGGIGAECLNFIPPVVGVNDKPNFVAFQKFILWIGVFHSFYQAIKCYFIKPGRGIVFIALQRVNFDIDSAINPTKIAEVLVLPFSPFAEYVEALCAQFRLSSRKKTVSENHWRAS